MYNNDVFTIIIPFFNIENSISKTINSLLDQTEKNFKCIWVDDGSSDKSSEILNSFIKDDSRFSLIKNKKNNGSPIENIVKGINYADINEEDICIIIDGDDWLIGSRVLEKIKNIYNENDINLTYGTYKTYPMNLENCPSELPKWVKEKSLYRCVYPFFLSPLRTFKGKLWKKLNNNHLKDNHGNYFKAASDAAFMFALAELSDGKIYFIEEALYCYNRSRNEHVDLKMPQLQKESMNQIRSMKTICDNQLTESQRWSMLTSSEIDELLTIEEKVMQSFDKIGKSFFKEPFNREKHSVILANTRGKIS